MNILSAGQAEQELRHMLITAGVQFHDVLTKYDDANDMTYIVVYGAGFLEKTPVHPHDMTLPLHAFAAKVLAPIVEKLKKPAPA